MQYRTLGRSGAVVSTLCLGTMTFGDEADETRTPQLDGFVAAGGTSSTPPTSTRPARPRRSSAAGSKRTPPRPRSGGRHQGPLPDGRRARTTSACRAGTSPGARRLAAAGSASSTIDLYQMHAWDALTPIEETLRFLDDAIRAGKIHYYGFSNFLGWQLHQGRPRRRATAAPPPVTLQPQYNLLVRDIEHEIVPACLDAGIGLLPWSPLAGGWLTRQVQARRAADRRHPARRGSRSAAWRPTEPRNADERTWAVIDAVRRSRGARRSAAAGGARLARGAPAVTSVILGARTVEQLADNLARGRPAPRPRRAGQRSTEASAPAIADYPYGTAGIAQRAPQDRGRPLSRSHTGPVARTGAAACGWSTRPVCGPPSRGDGRCPRAGAR